MTPEEYAEYKKVQSDPNVIDSVQLKDQSDRTLIYGFTAERATWHLYLKDLEFHLNIYGLEDCKYYKNYGTIIPVEDTVPTKRSYPAKCDFDFCCMLSAAGHHISFTTFDDPCKLPSLDPFWGDIK